MEFIKIEDKNSCFLITLNRPEKRNAFHPQMIKEITEAFNSVENSSARYVHLVGSGESFCAGADLEWMKSMKEFNLSENIADSVELFNMFEAVSRCPLPITAKVKGHVMGGANGLLAMCDVVAAEENTKFAFSEVLLGLVPAVISPFILSKMHKSSARNLMITGRRFDAQEALVGGLIEFKGSVEAVDKYLESVHKSICAAGPDAVDETISLLGAIESGLDWEEIKDLTTKVIAERRVS